MSFFTDEKSKLFSDLGMKCCMEGDLEKGLKYFNTGLEYNGDNVLLLYNKGGCLVSMGETEKAEAVFKRVIEICDKMGKFEFSLRTKANSYVFLNDPENARIAFEELLEIAPDDVNALINMAQILKKKYHYEESLPYLDKALKIDPQNSDAMMFKGEALYYLFRYDEAKDYIDRSFEISTENHYIWYLKGECESHFENHEKAVEYYSKAIEMEPNFERCYYDLGISLIILGRAEEAKVAFRKVFDMNPEDYEDERAELSDEIVDMLSQHFPRKDS
ncbi:lipopolysaccharide assembly protein LapB [uncultured Methanobrevibacter sp.]|uniref:tetratricopeptide repeat protein n=1 Tax=uncultured Methanobrevibacter sp. TaxID=253161 RepID=UPI002620984B|nr:tetratricopeptide repeat protein [uncultured Methanobrevibacter sp.]